MIDFFQSLPGWVQVVLILQVLFWTITLILGAIANSGGG